MRGLRFPDLDELTWWPNRWYCREWFFMSWSGLLNLYALFCIIHATNFMQRTRTFRSPDFYQLDAHRCELWYFHTLNTFLYLSSCRCYVTWPVVARVDRWLFCMRMRNVICNVCRNKWIETETSLLEVRERPAHGEGGGTHFEMHRC